MILGLDALPGKLSAYAADLGNALSAELMAIAQQAADIARDAAPEGQPPRDEPRL